MVYQPRKAIHPGRTIERTIDELGMTQKQLADRTGLSEKHISQIINGEASVTADTALLLANAIGGTESFWSNLDKNYRATLARIEQAKRLEQEQEMLIEFPYAQLVKLGRVGQTSNKSEKVFNLWRFFGVNSLTQISTTEAVAYRRGYIDNIKQGSLAAWLRCGELDAAPFLACAPEYDAAKLKDSLIEIRKITAEMSDDFFKRTQDLLASAGVGLVAATHIAGTKASGATRWINGRPIIQLSAYGKDADKMWFTLFHEIGHVLKHGKREQFISFTSGVKSTDEQEADAFAAETLIPSSAYAKFLTTGNFSEQSIRKFANQQQIHTGIVVGRLKNDRILPFSAMHHLHGKIAVRSDE